MLIFFYWKKKGKISMSELLFFVLGIIIGGLSATVIMCCLQVNKINDFEAEIKKLKQNCNEELSEN